jgi:hypothetical protein
MEHQEQEKMISQYVRDRRGQPRGVVVAKKVNGVVKVGWSYVNVNAGDEFNKNLAYKIAVGRTLKDTNATMPHDVKKTVCVFTPRANKYFHQPTV